METLARIQEIPFADRPVVVMISGHGTIETAVQRHQARRLRFPRKAALHRESHRGRQERPRAAPAGAGEQRACKADTGSRYRIIGESVPMKALRQQLALMAGTNGRVLIYGESGTGKELVAHAIHAMSPRAAEAVRRSELRRHSRRADRKRAVRPQQGQLHQRARRQDRQVPEGRRRHAVSGRSRRHEPADPGQGAARARRAALRAGGRRANPFRWMCAWSPPPTRIWKRRSSAATSAKICSTA